MRIGRSKEKKMNSYVIDISKFVEFSDNVTWESSRAIARFVQNRAPPMRRVCVVHTGADSSPTRGLHIVFMYMHTHMLSSTKNIVG